MITPFNLPSFFKNNCSYKVTSHCLKVIPHISPPIKMRFRCAAGSLGRGMHCSVCFKRLDSVVTLTLSSKLMICFQGGPSQVEGDFRWSIM